MWLAAPVLVVLVGAVVVILTFAGCGANSGSAPVTGDQAQAGEDILLFAGGEDPSKSMSEGEVSKAPAGNPGVFLATNGHFHHAQNSEGWYNNYYFDTVAGRVYQVEVCSLTWQDDPDIYIGRNASIQPSGNYWKKSTRDDQYMDGIVFKASQTGPMYVAVHAHHDGSGDGNVDFTIHARAARFVVFTK